jgi:transcriptional regulator with XRE-family HTH domain
MLTIGEAIKKARVAKRYTKADLARKTGLSYQTLDKWEKGKTYPNVFNLIPIADVLNISLDELVGRDFKEKNLE